MFPVLRKKLEKNGHEEQRKVARTTVLGENKEKTFNILTP